jgi:hypothetical protein
LFVEVNVSHPGGPYPGGPPPRYQRDDATTVIPRQPHYGRGGLTAKTIAVVVGGVSAVGLVGGLGWALATGGGGSARAAAVGSVSASTTQATTTTAASTTTAPPTTSATSAAVTVTVVGYASQLCVTVPNDVGGSPLRLEQCGAGGTQHFTLSASGGGYTLTAASSGACIDLSGDSTSDGSAIDQATCSGTPSQTWLVQQQSGGDGQEYRVLDGATGKCLDAYGAATSAGTTLDQWPCKSNPFQDGNQVWRIVRT